MPEQMVLTFDKDLARGYLKAMHHFEAQRDELNEAITECRETAKNAGVPTKAVEAALKAAKGRRKSMLTSHEFGWLMDEAEKLLEATEPE